MPDRLAEYRRKRDPDRTPEPVPPSRDGQSDGEPASPGGDGFVIHQHHARRLHWDLRLERDGVLASWAVPRGIPRDPARNHLAVHTEDHPLEYATFSGAIPAGEYGAGHMVIYDQGTYTTEKWRDDEVIVVLHGSRVSGRYVLFRTSGRDWMIHRMDPPEPGWRAMPDRVAPMTAVPADQLPTGGAGWGFELTWRGVRAGAYLAGGQTILRSADGQDVTASYPELRPLAGALAPTECVLDGVIVAFDPQGRVSPATLRPRAGARGQAAIRRLADRVPVHLFVFDLLWLDGRHTVDLPYTRRRELLATLAVTGDRWQTPPYFPGDGPAALRTSREQGLPGVIAKRLDAPYQPGSAAGSWLSITGRRHRQVAGETRTTAGPSGQ